MNFYPHFEFSIYLVCIVLYKIHYFCRIEVLKYYKSYQMGKILIAGGTGFVGSNLKKHLEENGYEVYILSTQKNKVAQNIFYWMPAQEIFEGNESLDFEAVINLAGANIAEKLWTKSRKQELEDSRVLTTKFICKMINEERIKTNYLLQASAIGYYGNAKDQILTENSSLGTGFMAQLCDKWEQAVSLDKIPFSIVRISVVLDHKEGAYPKLMMTTPFRFAQIFDGGEAYLSWISSSDLSRMFLFLINKKETGVYNAVSNTLTYRNFYKKYFEFYKKAFVLIPFPSFIFKILLGDFSEIFLNSQRIEKSRILIDGFEFLEDSYEKFLALPKN